MGIGFHSILNKLFNRNDMADASEFSLPSPYDVRNYHRMKSGKEFRIMIASQLIRQKKGWREDMKNDQVINNWKEESINQGLTTEEFDCVVERLKYYNDSTAGLIEVTTVVDGTMQADNLVSEQLKSELMEAVDDLLHQPYKKDYDPGTDNLVINLIDPSLYCLVNDVTRVKVNAVPSLRFIGGRIKFVAPMRQERCSSTKILEYQWLPSEFHITTKGQVKINSYINNVHPINDRHLYTLIGKIFECFIPLFNGVLNDLLKLNDMPTHPAIEHNMLASSSSSTKTFDMRGRNIQVIVKMKSIELTPEKYDFKAGNWHIEGNKSEHIVATGIYCFQSENITQSRLNFRQNKGVKQESGSIVTCEDRLLAFPNVYQHRIDSFQLVDKSKPGYRKILVFFLVDPTKPITSTRDVPPQQMSWFNEKLHEIPPFDRLDLYVVERITSFLPWPMSRKMAEEYRLRLIEDRRTFGRSKKITVESRID